MKGELNIWIIGGDLRQVRLAQLLERDGHQVHTYGLDGAMDGSLVCEEGLSGAARAQCVVLPLPTRGEGGLLNAPLSSRRHSLSQVLDALPGGGVLCAGQVDEALRVMAARRGLVLHDYFDREELAVANAIPTVEGALQIAMEELPVTLHGSRVLVIGCGRLGKLLGHRLAALGADVTVSARRWADLAWAGAYGWKSLRTDRLEGCLGDFELVFNTVPAPVLGQPRLAELAPGCLVIELASKPGGVDMDAAQRLGVKVIWALSLPGRVAPVTAGRAIRDTVYHILREQGV